MRTTLSHLGRQGSFWRVGSWIRPFLHCQKWGFPPISFPLLFGERDILTKFLCVLLLGIVREKVGQMKVLIDWKIMNHAYSNDLELEWVRCGWLLELDPRLERLGSRKGTGILKGRKSEIDEVWIGTRQLERRKRNGRLRFVDYLEVVEKVGSRS